jgi:hypothetical protein
MKRLALLCFTLTSCGTTGGRLIQIEFRAGGVSRPAAGPLTFSTPQGWAVTLQTARIALGPFYFNLSPPPTSTFRGGVVIMEATAQVIVDPLDPTLKEVAGGADGETGDSLVCEIDLFPPDPTASVGDRQLLGNNGIGYVAGTATKGATTVPFAGNIVINANLVTPQTPLVALQRVNGAAAVLSFTAQTQAVEVRVDPRGWFDSLDFTALLAGTPVGGNYTWNAANCDQGSASFDGARCAFQNSLVAGVQQRSGVYQFTVRP